MDFLLRMNSSPRKEIQNKTPVMGFLLDFLQSKGFLTMNKVNILNFTGRGYESVPVQQNNRAVALVLDKNFIVVLDNLKFYPLLQQLSLSSNRLTHIHGLKSLVHLRVLNLTSNLIHNIAGLSELSQLTWLNLSNNSIKVIDNLQQCEQLEHLDLSDNAIVQLGNLTTLRMLKTLLLHGNSLISLRSAPQNLPLSLTIISLADNNISDLNEVSLLSGLTDLEQLSVMMNPCVMTSGDLPKFDYRPFVVNWCMNLRILDGYLVTETEGLKAEWLYSQGKGRYFKVGQHAQLVQYLAHTCPLHEPAQGASAEDDKLRRVLDQQRAHQQSLEEEALLNTLSSQLQALPFASYSPPKVSTVVHDPSPALVMQQQGPVDISSYNQYLGRNQAFPIRAWPSRPGTAEQTARPHTASGQRAAAHQQDLTSDEASSMLEAETRYLPLSSDLTSSPKHFNFETPTARPRTAPPASEQNIDPTSGHRNHERSASNDSPGSGSLSKYDMLENRPIKPTQTRMSANYPPPSPKISPKAGSDLIGRPTPSDAIPTPHQRKRSASPVTKAINFTEDSDSDVKSQTAADLKAIRLMLVSGKKSATPIKGGKVSSKPVDVPHTPPHTSHTASHTSQSTRTQQSPQHQQQQYTPDKYSTPTRKALISHATHQSNDSYLKGESPGSGGNSHGYSQAQLGHPAFTQDNAKDRNHTHLPNTATFPSDMQNGKGRVQTYEAAAARIQAAWRAHHARQWDPHLLRARLERQARRADDHIRVLKTELIRQKQLYEKEKNLRSVQLDTLRYLVKEVQSLQRWKGDILVELERTGALGTDRELLDGGVHASTEHLRQSSQQLAETFMQASLNREVGFSLTPKKSELSPHPTLSSPLLQPSSQSVSQSAKEQELETICKSLQKQVSELQQVLTSMSHYVFQGGVVSAKQHQPDGDDVRLSLEYREEENQQMLSTPAAQPPPSPQTGAFKSSQSITLTSSQKKLPPAGMPTAPGNLRMQEHGPTSVILQWEASVVYDQRGEATEAPLDGYRILVNGSPKGMVAGTQTRALLEGLQTRTMYRMTVKAVSSHGDSPHSNMVVLHPEFGEPTEEGRSHPRGDDSDEPTGGGESRGGPRSRSGSGSHPRRRRSSGNTDSPGAGSGNQGQNMPGDSHGGGSHPSTPKHKSPMHVQFDLSLPTHTDSAYTSPSPKDKYSKTFPPTHQNGEETERKTKRQTVVEQLKQSKALSISRENSSDSLMNKSDENVLSSSPRKGVGTDSGLDIGEMNKEEFVRFAIDKGLISTDDILKMAMKMSKRKSSADIQSPMKAFNTEDGQRLDDSLNDSGSSFKRELSFSKIPVFKGKPFESSNESIDIPSVKEKPSERSKSQTKDPKRLDSPPKRVQRKSSQRKNDERLHKGLRKRLDSSGSESCSPQVSPCNTSSGMSLSGTTGSESSGTEHARKRNPPEIAEYQKRSSTVSGRETETRSKQRDTETFAAARRISLTKPNPPPIPPPSQGIVRSGSFTKSEPDDLSENDTSTTLTPSQSHSQEQDNRASLSSHSQSKSITVQQEKRGMSPKSARKAQHKEKGYSPSFHDSRKVVLRREGSLDSMETNSHQSSPLTLRKVGSAPGSVSGSDEICQKIIQSDGSVVYKSIRKVSIDVMSDQSDADQSREIMNETFTVEIPGTLPDNPVDVTHEQPPVQDVSTVTKTTVIDNDTDDNQEESNELKLILDVDVQDPKFHRGRRGRQSHRSPRRRSKERSKERRASSLSAVMRNLNRKASQEKEEKEPAKEVVKNKPPKPPTGRSPSQGQSPSREDGGEPKKHGRKRTVSEQGLYPSDSDDANSASRQRPPRHRSKSRERGTNSRERSSERGSRSRDRSSERSSGSGERQGDLSSEGELGASQRSDRGDKSSPSPRRKTFIRSHQRSGSDLANIAALPDRPESPSPRRPAPPSTPKKALTSPRVRRSSSFSRAAESIEKEPAAQIAFGNKATVRQCISLETLKAVKSQSQEMMNRAGVDDNDDDDQDLVLSDLENDDTDLGGGAPQPPPRASHMRRSGSLRDDRLLYMSKYKNEFRTDEDAGSNTPRMGLGDYQDGVGYSPRLSGRKEEPKQQRRIKLGTKAADLFAKLQMKLSTGKNPDSPGAGS